MLESLSPDEAASVAGVHRATIYDWISSGRLRAQVIRGKRRITRQDLDAAMAQPPDLVAAHRAMLRESFDFFATRRLPLDTVGRYVPYAIYMNLLQLGRGLQTLLDGGFVEAGKPVVRTMIESALSIMAIVDDNSDCRALQFLFHQQSLRRKSLKRLVDQGLLSKERADTLDAHDTSLEDTTLAGWKAAGITPQPLGKSSRDTWHGLTYRDLATKMNATPWYDLYYGPFSDLGSHVTIGTVAAEVNAMISGAITIGPRDADPRHVVMASVTVVGESVKQMNNHLKLEAAEEAEAIYGRAWDTVVASISSPKRPPVQREPDFS